ncbi:hypothetical protein JXB11_03585 [Candidatus Woesearchaeota archaeon]|nr:hypothetical protein [Candidatus Woesearchaeota archaeon]
MKRPDLKSKPRTEWFKPKTVTEQLEEKLEAVGGSMPLYRRDPAGWTNRLVQAGLVLRPYYGFENRTMNQDEKWAQTIELEDGLKEYQSIILPYDAGLFPNVNRQLLSKKGMVDKIRYETNGADLRRSIRKKLLEKKSLDEWVVAMDFQGIRHTSRTYKIFTLLDCVRAKIMDDEMPIDAVEIEIYGAEKSDMLWSEGVMAVVKKVPSLSSKKKYEFEIKHIPVVPSEGVISHEVKEAIERTSFDLTTRHYCERTEYFDVKYGRGRQNFNPEDRRGDEQLLCHHFIFAMHRIEKAINQRYEEMKMLNPFPKPKQEIEDLFWKLLNQNIIEVYAGEKGEAKVPRLQRAPLAGGANVNLEIFLHNKVAYNNLNKA